MSGPAPEYIPSCWLGGGHRDFCQSGRIDGPSLSPRTRVLVDDAIKEVPPFAQRLDDEEAGRVLKTRPSVTMMLGCLRPLRTRTSVMSESTSEEKAALRMSSCLHAQTTPVCRCTA